MKYFLFTRILGIIGLLAGVITALLKGYDNFLDILAYGLGITLGFLLIGTVIDLLGFIFYKLFVDSKKK